MLLMENVSRRKFFSICLGSLSTAAVGAIAYTIYRYLAPVSTSSGQGKVSIATGEVTSGKARFFEFRGSTGVIIRTNKGELLAFSAICTHLGCIVQWEENKQDFLCPCHAGRYDSTGKVLSGPPPRPLERLPLALNGDTITVG
jgi:cytochrome b6-f complex iron-sulfur subunit